MTNKVYFHPCCSVFSAYSVYKRLCKMLGPKRQRKRDSHFRSDCLLRIQEQVYFLKKFETKNQILAGRSARRRMK